MKLRQLYQNGNAVVLAIPIDYAKALNLTPGTQVAVHVANRMLFIERARISGEGNHEAPLPKSEASRG